MKTRIDSVTNDRDGQFVVHVTHAEDGAEFPARPSGLCMIFRTKDEVAAFADQSQPKRAVEATRDAINAWRAESPELDIAVAAGKTSDDAQPIRGDVKLETVR